MIILTPAMIGLLAFGCFFLGIAISALYWSAKFFALSERARKLGEKVLRMKP